MKRKNILFTFFTLLTVFTSCGKYGYEFENGYQSGTETPSGEVDTVMNVADKSLYHRARIFPGLVGVPVPRIKDTLISVDMKFTDPRTTDMLVQALPKAIFSTSLYAPAGENIKIVVPEGVLGITVQIGAHMDNLAGKNPLRRDELIYTVKELFPGTNYVKNLYGGTIWLRANISQEKPIQLKFSGAVKAADFVLGKTDVQKWIAEVQNTDVPWLELRSKRTIYTVPRTSVLRMINEGRLRDMNLIMQEWDKIYEQDFYDWMGLTENAADLKNRYPTLPERGVLDIQPSAGYAHSGNPWVAQNDLQWFDEWTNLETMRAGRSWGTYHEIGHNYQQVGTWSWSGLGETTNNLFVFHGTHRNKTNIMGAHPSLAEQFPLALAYAAKAGAKNIINDAVSQDPFFKITLFLQLFNKIKGKNGEDGWAFMTHLYRTARNTDYYFGLDEAKRDFFYRELCNFTGRDYAKFCEAWGIVVSPMAKREMKLKFPAMETNIWTYNPMTNTGGNGAIPTKYDLDRSLWKLLSISSEELTGEGANNGKGIFILDGKNDSFWHSAWSTNPPGALPYVISLDMAVSEIVKGFYVVPRSSAGTRPRTIKIEISSNGSAYRELTTSDLAAGSTFDLKNTADRQEILLKSSLDVRFVKITFKDQSWGNSSHTSLAEFGAFYDVD